jgi:integrase
MARERKGSIVERDKKIYARIQFLDECGKKRDIWRKADNRTHAREIIKQLLNEIENAGTKQIDAANMTFAELADYFIKNYLHEAVYSGDMKISGVRGRVEALCEVKPLQEYFGKRKINQITYGDIRTYKQTRLGAKTRNGNQRSLASVNKELGKLRRMFNIAVREQWLKRNPFNNGESLISVETHRLRILSRDEEKRLFAAIDVEPKRAHLKGITLLALDCALRRGEIFTLKWSEVNLDQRAITITAFNSKTARSRTVAMTIRVYQELERLWQSSLQKPDDLVFGKLTTIKKGFGKALMAAGIDDFHFHDCRATCISRMIQAGLPPAEVMRISGHSTLSAFYIYVRTNMESVYRAASVLDSFNAGQETQDLSKELVH